MSAEVEVVPPLKIPLRRLGERELLGFHQTWMSGQSEDGVEVDVGCSAGLGGSWFSLTVCLPDGRRITEVADLQPIVQEWAARLQATLESEAS